jgi:hypothetical protein
MDSKTLSRGWRALSRHILIGATAACAMAADAAIVVQYHTTALGGGLWRNDYTLEGVAPLGGFDGVTIYFDAGSYAQLADALAPPGWDVLVVQPDSGVPADGLLDLLNLGGLLTGDVGTIAFSVDFEYLGLGAPAPQRFELYQTTPFFEVVAQGDTVQANDVPEPATGALVLLALSGAMLRARSARRAKHAL